MNDESLFLFLPHLCLPVIGCWHFDKRQRSWSAGLPGGVWVRAGCFYICHRAPGLRPSSDPDLSPAPSRELPINPSRHGWERVQASVLDAFPPYLPPPQHKYSSSIRAVTEQMQFPLSSFQNAPKSTVLHGGGDIWLWQWYHLQSSTHVYMPLFVQIIRRFLWR